MNRADLKPQRRIVDPVLMRELADAGQQLRCVVCEQSPTEPHHVRLRSRGGDDLEANIMFLCRRCHGSYHRRDQYEGEVRRKMGRWIMSDHGKATRAYLVGKLGRSVAEIYLKREFGVRL